MGTSVVTAQKSEQVKKRAIEIDIISEKNVKHYTGLDSLKLYHILLEYLLAPCSDPNCNVSCHDVNENPSHKFCFLSTTNQFLMTLCFCVTVSI